MSDIYTYVINYIQAFFIFTPTLHLYWICGWNNNGAWIIITIEKLIYKTRRRGHLILSFMIKSVDVGWKVFSRTMVHNSSHLYIIYVERIIWSTKYLLIATTNPSTLYKGEDYYWTIENRWGVYIYVPN